MKLCNFCLEEKDESDFYKQSNRKDLKTKCKKCHSEYSKEYQEKHREEANKRVQKYREKHPDKILQYNQGHKKERCEAVKRYNKKNRDSIKKYMTEYNSRYIKTKTSKFHQWKTRVEHLLKKRGISSSMTREEWESFWQKPCEYCGNKIETIGIDRIDNTKGYALDNCNPCCSICNRTKGQLSLEEFRNWSKTLFKDSTTREVS